MVRSLLTASLAAVIRGALVANEFGQPQEMKGSAATSSDVCGGRSDHCSVWLDVPTACAGESSSCPIIFMFHGHGGSNNGFPRESVGVHDYNFIGISPRGELYDGKSGWNDGSMAGNQCAWDDFECSKDPNDGLFVAGIVKVVRDLGAAGRVYLYGTSNGANEVQILASNAGDGLPIAGIAARSGQLLAEPTRSAGNPYNWNQPCAGSQPCVGGSAVAQLSMHGDADNTIPYTGGPRFKSDVFILMNEPESDVVWKTQNGCTGNLSSSIVPATSKKPETQDAEYFSWGGCPATAPVEYYKVHGAPHGAANTLRGQPFFVTVFEFFCKVELAHGGAKCPDSPAPTPTPPPAPSPSPSPSPTPDAPPAACQTCIQDACSDSRAEFAACSKCVQQNRQACASSCKPYKFRDTLSWFCGSGSFII